MEDVTVTLDLVRRAQGGDEQALNRIFERYYDRVRRIVRLRLDPKLRRFADTGDVLQRTFMAALNRFDDFELRTETGLVNWLTVLAQNQIRDLRKYANADARDPALERPLVMPSESGSQFVPVDLPAGLLSPSGELAHREDIELVENAVAELAPEYRELIIQRNYLGGTWQEVAAATGSPSEDAARMRHATAMAQLARLLRDRRKQKEE